MNSASAPRSRNSATNACPASLWRPETTMRLPSAAKASAAARPMPVNAPVIRTTGVFVSSLLRPTPDSQCGGRSSAVPQGSDLVFPRVAEEGSLTLAAKRRLHTAQPSLSRQIHDLETEVGAELMTRSARGIDLTAAGRVFLD